MGYECIMCMELLEAPAPDSLVAIPSDLEVPKPTSGRKYANKKSTSNGDLTVICATICGHMFHRACLNRWFHQKQRKECPSCRKLLTPGKIFNLYPPGSSEDFPTNNNNNGALQLTEFEERSLPQVHCINEGCTQLFEIHKTLVSDYNKLLEKYTEKSDNLDLSTAQIQSLEDECARLNNMNIEYKYASTSRNALNYKMQKCPICKKYSNRAYTGQECKYCKPEIIPGRSTELLNRNSPPQTPPSTVSGVEMKVQIPVGTKRGNISVPATSATRTTNAGPSLIRFPYVTEPLTATKPASPSICSNLNSIFDAILANSKPPPTVSTSCQGSNFGKTAPKPAFTLLTTGSGSTLSLMPSKPSPVVSISCPVPTIPQTPSKREPAVSTSYLLPTIIDSPTMLNKSNRVYLNAKRSQKYSEWQCSICLAVNRCPEDKCNICGTKNHNVLPKRDVKLLVSCSAVPVATTSAALLNAPQFEGGRSMWTCPNCSVPNEPSSSACVFCKTIKVESKKELSTSSSSSKAVASPLAAVPFPTFKSDIVNPLLSSFSSSNWDELFQRCYATGSDELSNSDSPVTSEPKVFTLSPPCTQSLSNGTPSPPCSDENGGQNLKHVPMLIPMDTEEADKPQSSFSDIAGQEQRQNTSTILNPETGQKIFIDGDLPELLVGRFPENLHTQDSAITSDPQK